MEPIRKPLSVLVALLACGLPLDVASSDSEIQLSALLQTHRNAARSTEVPLSQMAAKVEGVVSDVARINHHNEVLRQRVLLLEARLARELRELQESQKYQPEVAMVAATTPSPVVNNTVRLPAKTISDNGDILPTALSPVSMRMQSLKPDIAPPDVAVKDEQIVAKDQQPVLQSADGAAPAESQGGAIDAPPIAAASADNIEIADAIVEQSPVGEQLAMNDTTLNDMRGGFTTTSGLQISFGIERAIYINGDLISTTSLNIVNVGSLPTVPSVSDLTKNLPDAATLTKSVTSSLPQTNVGTPGAGQASAAAASSSAASGAAGGSAAGASGTSSAVATTPTASAASVANSASSSSATSSISPDVGMASLAVIQSGAGNTVQSATIAPSTVGTVIQNSLNNQKIQNVTVINAAVNSMEVLKALNLQSRISTAINESLSR